jgi:hypothetical protein
MPPESDPAYVSPAQYSDYNCKQIKLEMQRITAHLQPSKQADTTGQVLNTALLAYAVSKDYSFYQGGQDNTETRRLQNQYNVLEQTAVKKECE